MPLSLSSVSEFFAQTTLTDLSLVTGVSLALYTYYKKKDEPRLRQNEKELMKRLNMDILQLNEFMIFGPRRGSCQHHNNFRFWCDNLDCNHGRLGHILKMVRTAKRTLDVCIYIITAPIVANEISVAHKNGVKVRVIADHDMANSPQSSTHVLSEHGIPIRRRKSYYIMHHKFIVVDDELLLNGSLNFTMTGAFCNWETVTITSQPQLVRPFVVHFDELWNEFGP